VTLDSIIFFCKGDKNSLEGREEISPTLVPEYLPFCILVNSLFNSFILFLAASVLASKSRTILKLIYPTTQTSPPYLADIKKSPRLQVLDTGMLNYFSGLQVQILGTNDLNSIYQGRIVEHIVGQELIANHDDILHPIKFWIRDKKESSAEVDFLFPYNGRMIPVEVKSGATGKLRSLHLYMDLSEETLAIRLCAGECRIDLVETASGKTYQLHSLPYYLAGNIKKYLDSFAS
jgi:hypothetical protein